MSPALAWKNPPAGTKGYAVTVYDPDAPTGSGWWHWVVYNIPATVTSLPVGAGDRGGAKLPAGALQGRTDFGTAGWGGPCPPKGDKPHRYVFTVHALKTDKLDVPADATAASCRLRDQREPPRPGEPHRHVRASMTRFASPASA